MGWENCALAREDLDPMADRFFRPSDVQYDTIRYDA